MRHKILLRFSANYTFIWERMTRAKKSPAASAFAAQPLGDSLKTRRLSRFCPFRAAPYLLRAKRSQSGKRKVSAENCYRPKCGAKVTEGRQKTYGMDFPAALRAWRGIVKKKKPGSHLLSRLEGTIIGAGELDFRVRDGNGYCLSAMAAGR